MEGYLSPLLADAELRVEVTDGGLSLDGLGLELLDLRQEVSGTLATGHEGRQLQLNICIKQNGFRASIAISIAVNSKTSLYLCDF